jgi:phosphoribosylaminoimidazole-succinocarboxamide synthase
VRGYLSVSGWKAYQTSGRLLEYDLSVGLQESSQLPHALFTPTTNADAGHDMPIDCADAAALIGRELFIRYERSAYNDRRWVADLLKRPISFWPILNLSLA